MKSFDCLRVCPQLFLAVIGHCLFAGNASFAQCIDQWLPGERAIDAPGTRSLIEWDPDGPGPLPTVLAFATQGGVYTWDGVNWGRVGGFLSDVRCLVVFNGSLYASTNIGFTNSPGVYRWNGTFWEGVGLGMGGVSNAYVQVLFPFANQLIAGGGFFTADGASANCIAAWDGVRWNPLGLGLNNSVWALANYQGNLIAGGAFINTSGVPVAHIARWDGTFWQPLGAGIDNNVYSVLVQGSSLYASGVFSNAGGVPASRVAQWDGSSWHNLGSGLSGQGTVLIDDAGGFIAGGSFTTAGEVSAANLARWDGQTWSAWSPGTNGEVLGMLRASSGRIYASGSFNYSEGRRVGATVYQDAGHLHRMWGGFDNPVRSLTNFNGDLAIGGDFSTYHDSAVSTVCRWNNGELVSLGQAPCLAVALATWNGALYVAGPGRLPYAPTTTSNVWKWDGSTWIALGTGVNNTLSALCVYHDQLVAAGSFSSMSGLATRSIARYDGSSWLSLGSGLNFNGNPATIKGLTVHGDTLVATGVVNQSPGQPLLSFGVTGWNGSNWINFGTGTQDDPNTIEVTGATSYNGRLYVFGGFQVLDHHPIQRIGRWTGSTFEPVGTGVNGGIFALREYQGRLIAIGRTLSLNSVSVPALAWDDSVWVGLDSGITDVSISVSAPFASAVFDNQLFIAGDFSTAAGKPSKWLARWSEASAPFITTHPVSTSSCNHRAAAFAVVAQGRSLQYRWEKDGVPIDLIANPSAGTPNLTIAFPIALDAGSYACRVTGDCGSALSDSASLAVCEADFNCDSAVDFFDYLDFVDAFANGSSAADFNADQVVDFFDYLDFVDAFSTGC